mmetsp:Transcript_12348/g.51696  ORF Transcript_12348/g.51696 Transcript_12348/m.51696 type:complete len:273 (+) Transcript_12348:339-1157(+)
MTRRRRREPTRRCVRCFARTVHTAGSNRSRRGPRSKGHAGRTSARNDRNERTRRPRQSERRLLPLPTRGLRTTPRRPKRLTRAKKKTPRRRYTRFKTTTACSSWIASGGRSSSATARCWTTPRPRWTWTISSRAWTPARWDTTSVTATSAGAARRRVRNSATPNSSTPSSRFCFASALSGGTSREDRRGPKVKPRQRPDSIPRFWRSRRPRAWTPRTPRCFAKISCLARGAGFDARATTTLRWLKKRAREKKTRGAKPNATRTSSLYSGAPR